MKTKVLTILFVLTISLNAGIGVGTSAEGALPVELTTFTAAATSDNVQLNWTTVTEVDNYGFEIERKNPLLNPLQGGDFEKIGFIEGHGNSNSPKEYSFVDESVFPGLYQYRLKQIDTDGSFEYSEIIEVQFGVVPTKYVLAQNYPNPFNPSTVISYSIPTASNVSLKVFDVLGKLIKTLVNQNQAAGNYKINFNAGELSNGVYFYRIESGSFIAVKKMLLIK
jgi:hypothetical protein